jgi:integrase
LAGVWLPEALERKYPGAATSWEWFWFFPSRQVSLDPHAGVNRRHHLLDGAFQLAVRAAARRAGLNKRVTPHTLRQNAECREMPSELHKPVKTKVES